MACIRIESTGVRLHHHGEGSRIRFIRHRPFLVKTARSRDIADNKMPADKFGGLK